MLIVRTNAVGDYVLWRNILPVIRQSARFKDYHITLIGNHIWKPLFDAYDVAYVDDVIWLDGARYKKDMRYRIRMLSTVRRAGFETIINTLSSRCKRVDDSFVLAVPEAVTIGQWSDETNVFDYERGYDKGLFDEYYGKPFYFEFEFERSRIFSEFFLKEAVPQSIQPHFSKREELSLKKELLEALIGKPYFLIFPGSGAAYRIWSPARFARIAKLVAERWNWLPVLCGAPSDRPYVDAVLKELEVAAADFCGKTSLTDTVLLAQGAAGAVSIDTGSAHIAAVAGCPFFGIFNGSHYGRYSPYPKEVNPAAYAIYPEEVLKEVAQDPVPQRFNHIVDISYGDVSEVQVRNTMIAHYGAGSEQSTVMEEIPSP